MVQETTVDRKRWRDEQVAARMHLMDEERKPPVVVVVEPVEKGGRDPEPEPVEAVDEPEKKRKKAIKEEEIVEEVDPIVSDDEIEDEPEE